MLRLLVCASPVPGWSNKLGTTFCYAGTRCVTSSRVDTVPGILTYCLPLTYHLIVRILICVGQMLGVSIQGLVFCGLKLSLIYCTTYV